ncbi:putative ABC transporter ATP-binding protein [Gordonia hirsuta DSM 44140 = NBRC 16056]|uniref:Putative ABC transporter ATP-binding protein n=1 Tax=Gordonia hirsuta DSM 44140 = NBRC 16056 TaxID=1121927 RepID=L7L584_9ACTN|nr:ABC transporter ATP-binding protein [Gordonia hirsuta]GAC56300.1 putative ABC transporter ATP-binding protein [Gordonia hirsuta DSM 44140 = NBRC 16056]
MSGDRTTSGRRGGPDRRPPQIELAGVGVRIGAKVLLDDVCATVPAGGFTGIIGPNGSGKTTLLSTVARWITPATGQVLLDGTPVRAYSGRELARVMATVEQHSVTEADLTVEQVVDLGTIPRAGGRLRRIDTREIVDDALTALGLQKLRTRTWQSLSGGERQKTQMARALAQQPRVLVLDEPTNHLDVAASLELLAQLRDLPVTAVAALHDLQLAGLYCDHLIVLAGGRVVAEGPPALVLTPALLDRVYGLDAEVMPHPRSGAPLVILNGVQRHGGAQPETEQI